MALLPFVVWLLVAFHSVALLPFMVWLLLPPFMMWLCHLSWRGSVAFHGVALSPFMVRLCCLFHNVAVVADCSVTEFAIFLTFESFYSTCSVNLVVFLCEVLGE